MKRCPNCGQTYSDPALNFCLADGELLSYLSPDAPFDQVGGSTRDDSPPTMVMDRSRVTDPTNWAPRSGLPAQWQDPSPAGAGRQYPMGQYRARVTDQTLPTISLVLGIIACFLVCCTGGIWLGLPAAIVGFLGMRNVDKDPYNYGGRGMAIAGMVLGIITFLISTFILIVGSLPQ
jgi:hypothetical protein